ncbi:DUF4136 domain-containing protein [Lacihabitans lacunae]|jgi:hypothetical protein|uniref:DUF4136 domain-containing protein n=1 Tax=Lacihabitans lacunae TaxID=1028214 RepID=A0ABV7YW08_9BACT
MKRIIFSLILLASLSSCFRNRVFVEHDYRYSLGFENYLTYSFVDCPRDTNFLCEDVQQAIMAQMQARGYRYSGSSPDLFVNFHVYYDAIKYTGYDQPTMGFWLNDLNEEEKYKQVKYSLKKGTLMISLIEGQSSEIVWRGYATGIFNDHSNRKSYFKNIVTTIFAEYPLFATDVAWRRSKLNKSI